MKLNGIFRDGMILPANKPIHVFGESNEEVEICFLGTTKKAQPKDNNFFIELPANPYGGPYEMTVKCGKDEITICNIYVGEVFLMSGQSNMEFKVKEGEDDLSDGEDDSLLRMYACDHIIFSDGDLEYFRQSNGWVQCKKQEIREWSSLAYQVGRTIRKEKNVAVGVICCYQGASIIESWLPEYALKDPAIELDIGKKHEDHTCKNYRLWNEDSRLYDFALSQILPFSVSAVVWYQGESDTSYEEGLIYDKELQLLVSSWRKSFLDEELPFVIVQIADFDCRDDKGWHEIQFAQGRAVEKIENSYLVVSKDICDTDVIHPPKKKLLAGRIGDKLLTIL